MYQTTDNAKFRTMSEALQHQRQIALEYYIEDDDAISALLRNWYSIHDIMTKNEPLLACIQSVREREECHG